MNISSSESDEEAEKPELEGGIEEEHLGSASGHRRRKRIKIRKRVRIKRKSSPKKKLRKVLESVAWVLVIAAFIVTLVVLMLQLDLNSKKKKRSAPASYQPTEHVENPFPLA